MWPLGRYLHQGCLERPSPIPYHGGMDNKKMLFQYQPRAKSAVRPLNKPFLVAGLFTEGGGLPRLCQPGSRSCKVQQSWLGWGSDCSCLSSWSHPWCWEQRSSHGAAAQEPSLSLLPEKGQLWLYDFTSWVTLCSRCNAITITDVSAITARAAWEMLVIFQRKSGKEISSFCVWGNFKFLLASFSLKRKVWETCFS